MSNENARASRRQENFLSALSEKPLTLEELMADQGVARALLGQWLASPRFQRRLEKRLDGVRRVAAIQRLLGTRRALEKLLEIVSNDGEKSADAQRRACIDVLKLSEPAAAKESKKPSRPATPFHPEITPDRARELLEAMKREPSTG